MTLALLMVFLVLGETPKVWIVDTSILPFQSPFDYSFTTNFMMKDEKSGEITMMGFKGSDPEDLHSGLECQFVNRKGWNVKTKGLELHFVDVDGKPLKRVWTTGDGPKPVVRWEFALPPPAAPAKK